MKLKIIDFDYKGRGFAKDEGKAYFLDGGVIGDKVLASIKEEKKKYTIAKIDKILEPSEDRVESKCKYSSLCGGCDFLSYKYSKQLNWKKNKVETDLNRIGQLDVKVDQIFGMENPYNYRNNIQLKVKDGKLGYYIKNSRNLIPVDKCIIAEEEINKAINILKDWKGLSSINDIIIRENYKKELMIILVTKNKVSKINNLLGKLLDINLVSLYENINKNPRFRFGKEFNKLYGKDYLIDKLFDFQFKVSPSSFFQVNRLQTEKLYKLAVEGLDLKKEDIVLDLYCGIGTISMLAAKGSKEVIGVEISEKAIEDARFNQELNKVENTRFIAGKSEDIIEKLIEEENIIPNKVILDPPRSGIDEKLVNKLLELKVEKIAYVSCNSSTQARDLKLLKEAYKIDKVYAVDMFCNSVHVETIALLSKLDTDEHINI